MTPLDRQTLSRLAFLFAAFGGFTLVLVARLAYWQVLYHPDLQAADTANQLQPGRILPGRGSIYDSRGRLLAADTPSYILAVDARALLAGPDNVGKLARALGRSEADLRSALAGKEQRTYVRLGRGLSEAAVKPVREAKIYGVSLETEAQRVYPMGSLAAHVLGFVNAEGVGFYGIEEYYDHALRGEAGTWGGVVTIDPARFRAPRDGFDIVLTIDSYIQRLTERELTKAIEAQDAAGGSAIVMDPKTGAILAMASVPTYDPNQYSSVPKERFTNPAVSSLYEPGSVIKAMTLAAALEANVATLDTTYNDVGWIRVQGHTIWDWDRMAHGKVDMRTMMRLSLNVGAVHLGQMLGPDRFYRSMRAFGFGTPTGIDLSGEVNGLINDPRNAQVTDLDLAVNAFGQGMASTPIQVITAMAAIANGGKLMQPYVVQEIRQGDKTIKATKPIVLHQVVSLATADKVTDSLVGVVEHAIRASVPGYTIGGKTGSSQIPTEKGYDPEATIASFCGFGPVNDPRFVILVKVDRPVHKQLGSEVAAPFFGALARQIFDYLDIPPDNTRAALNDGRNP